MDAALIVTQPRASGPDKPGTAPLQLNKWRRLTPRGGIPWHSRCHYPRSHSISGTVVVLAAGSLPAGLAPSENRTGCSIGDRSAPLRTSTYCRSSYRCADGPLKCGRHERRIHPRQLDGSRGAMDPGGAQFPLMPLSLRERAGVRVDTCSWTARAGGPCRGPERRLAAGEPCGPSPPRLRRRGASC